MNILEETNSIFYKHMNRSWVLFYLKDAAFKSQNAFPSGLLTNIYPLFPSLVVIFIDSLC